jgi:hypothetical protein
MTRELDIAKDYFKSNFDGIAKPGIYPVPITTSKGDAFIKVVLSDTYKLSGFDLFWDEALTISWYDNPKQ